MNVSVSEARLDAARPPQRLITRIVMDLALDVVGAYNRALGGHYRQALILMALRHAGLEACARDAAHLADYARAPGHAPVRPIPVHALAASMNLSPETTRRVMAALEVEGLSARGPGGVVAVHRPLFTPLDELVAEGLARACTTLVALDLDPLATWGGAFAEAPANPGLDPAQRRAGRALAAVDYLISLVGTVLTARDGDILGNAVFLAVMAENAAAVTASAELAWRYAFADTPPPDDIRRPATVATVAERLGLVHETVRRAALKAAEAGMLVRRRGGYLVPVPALQGGGQLERGLDLYRRFIRLNALLASAGLHPLQEA